MSVPNGPTISPYIVRVVLVDASTKRSFDEILYDGNIEAANINEAIMEASKRTKQYVDVNYPNRNVDFRIKNAQTVSFYENNRKGRTEKTKPKPKTKETSVNPIENIVKAVFRRNGETQGPSKQKAKVKFKYPKGFFCPVDTLCENTYTIKSSKDFLIKE